MLRSGHRLHRLRTTHTATATIPTAPAIATAVAALSATISVASATIPAAAVTAAVTSVASAVSTSTVATSVAPAVSTSTVATSVASAAFSSTVSTPGTTTQFTALEGRIRALEAALAERDTLTEQATAIKTKFLVAEDKKVEREQLLAVGKTDEAAAVKIDIIDFPAELKVLTDTLPLYRTASAEFAVKLMAALDKAPQMPTPELTARLDRLRQLTKDYIATFPATQRLLETWDYTRPIPWYQSGLSFITGKQWLTASFWQDFYGIVPLFMGSFMVSLVALALAVPFGVGAAIYVNQMASAREQRMIKPCIEFIAAFPSVVLGFFGIAVLGETLRLLSQQEWLAWVPGFPFSERLNILTAGCLLALIAVPTIFTLAEDALQNVPKAFKEASFALGATRLQTIVRIIVPASLSGIISAVLLGLGRVIGETMVVLLCAGNRIAIPDFSAGLAVITQPVHTMTGIIAQEMGEVVQGSIHYRALFVVGLVLFFLSLTINFLAQKIVRKYRISIG